MGTDVLQDLQALCEEIIASGAVNGTERNLVTALAGRVWHPDPRVLRVRSALAATKAIPAEIEGVLKELEDIRRGSDNDVTMKCWDNIRATLLNGCKGSLPRDIFESIVDQAAEVAERAIVVIRSLVSTANAEDGREGRDGR